MLISNLSIELGITVICVIQAFLRIVNLAVKQNIEIIPRTKNSIYKVMKPEKLDNWLAVEQRRYIRIIQKTNSKNPTQITALQTMKYSFFTNLNLSSVKQRSKHFGISKNKNARIWRIIPAIAA